MNYVIENRKDNSIAVVTGAAHGIGKAFAVYLAEIGFNLLLLDSDSESLESLQGALINKYQRDVEVLTGDLTSVKHIEKAQNYISELSGIEVLINCAGFGVDGMFYDLPWGKHLKMINLQVVASTALIHAVLPQMIECKTGCIINVSSLSALLTAKGTVLYPTVKAYLQVLSQGLQKEVRDHNIKIQALMPGFTLGTKFYEQRNVQVAVSAPKIFWSDAAMVVSKSIKALSSNKVIFVPGFINKLLYLLLRLKVINFLFMIRSKFQAIK